ncbi:MAG TPA: hypothetical protein IAC66_07590 [Candidatus Aphodousia gallistercoris]|nr:hypothetical protein [Candidatus Aphodousia gallistercoris]
MKVRKLTSTGDYRLGHADNDFFVDTAEGVAQNVLTRLALWQGQWFIDSSEGTPWLQQVLGKHNAVDTVIKNRILETPGVLSISEYESILNPDTRSLTVTATIQTQYGQTTIESEMQ